MSPTSPRPFARFSVVDLTKWGSLDDVLRVERPGGEGREHLSCPGSIERAAPMTADEHTREALGALGHDATTLDTRLAEGVIDRFGGAIT